MDLDRMREQLAKKVLIEQFKKDVRNSIKLHTDFRSDQLYESGQQYHPIISAIDKGFGPEWMDKFFCKFKEEVDKEGAKRATHENFYSKPYDRSISNSEMTFGSFPSVIDNDGSYRDTSDRTNLIEDLFNSRQSSMQPERLNLPTAMGPEMTHSETPRSMSPEIICSETPRSLGPGWKIVPFDEEHSVPRNDRSTNIDKEFDPFEKDTLYSEELDPYIVSMEKLNKYISKRGHNYPKAIKKGSKEEIRERRLEQDIYQEKSNLAKRLREVLSYKKLEMLSEPEMSSSKEIDPNDYKVNIDNTFTDEGIQKMMYYKIDPYNITHTQFGKILSKCGPTSGGLKGEDKALFEEETEDLKKLRNRMFDYEKVLKMKGK